MYQRGRTVTGGTPHSINPRGMTEHPTQGGGLNTPPKGKDCYWRNTPQHHNLPLDHRTISTHCPTAVLTIGSGTNHRHPLAHSGNHRHPLPHSSNQCCHFNHAAAGGTPHCWCSSWCDTQTLEARCILDQR